MATKIFTYDLDGTLFRIDNTVHPETQRMLLEAKKQNAINIITTGRSYLRILEVLKEVQGIDYCVCSNGNVIYNVATKEHYILKKIDPQVFFLMHEYGKKGKLSLNVDAVIFDGAIVPKEWYTEGLPKWINDQHTFDLAEIWPKKEEDVLAVINNPKSEIVQLALRNPYDKSVETTEYIKAHLPKDCVAYWTNRIFTDVNPKGVSKYTGLKSLIDKLKIKNHKVYSFGDSSNDLEIIEHADVGIAMGNATDDLKKAAKIVIGDHNSDTIGATLKMLLSDF